MPGLIPENTLEEILGRVDIVEVVSGYIPLKRSGKNFKANCPFHHEKTPSFMVSSDRQIYHCFGCGESGNAFKFLMRYDRMEFPEAVETLAKKAGVILPERSDTNSQAVSLFGQLYKIIEQAGLFYEQNLCSPAGAAAKKYLLGRAIKEETIKLFRLGYCLDKWDGLIQYLRAKNISISLLEKVGLILARQEGGYYDRFRNRAIFPIIDIKSRVIGFGARVMDDSLPKYINSPESPVYTKGKNLYGLNLSKDPIRDQDFAVIVEGYLDFIMPYQEGLKNIVASQGTALTIDQARLLKRYTRNVTVVYDGDSAGELATLRSLDIFLEEDFSVKVASLPQELDPDSFVRKQGIAAFQELVKNADSLFDYKLKVLKTRFNAKEIEGKAKISGEMLSTINKFNNSVVKSEYTKRLAEELSVKESALFDELKKIKQPGRAGLSLPYPDNFASSPDKTAIIDPAEKLLIKLMLEDVELIHYIKQHLEPSDFCGGFTAKIVESMFELVSQGKTVDSRLLMDQVGGEEVSRLICESAFLSETSGQQKEKVVNDCIQRLKSQRLKAKKIYLQNQIKKAQASGDHEVVGMLAREFDLLIKKG